MSCTPPFPKIKKVPPSLRQDFYIFNLKFSSQSLIHTKFLPSPAKVKVKIEVCIKITSHLSSIYFRVQIYSLFSSRQINRHFFLLNLFLSATDFFFDPLFRKNHYFCTGGKTVDKLPYPVAKR
jgi:hypothetical protein